MFADLIRSIAVYVVPAIAIAVVPSWIAFEGARYFVSIRGQRMGRKGEFALDPDNEFNLSIVLGAMFAAVVCLFVYSINIIIAKLLLPEGIGETTAQETRAYLRTFSLPLTLMTLTWLLIQFVNMAKTVFKSKIGHNIVTIYAFLCIAATVLAKIPLVDRKGSSGDSITVLKIISYGYANMLPHLLSGPIFYAKDIAASSQLERWLTFAFLFLVVFTCQKYATHIFLKTYARAKGSDAFDLKAIDVALNVFVWLTSLVLSVSTLQVDVWSIGVFTAVVGAGVSISFRDLLNNFFSGILLNLDTSLKKRDVIRMADGTVGEVFKISLRYTQLQTRDNIDILIPNSVLVQSRFENLTRTQEEVRLSLRFLVGLAVDLDQVERIALRACRYVPEVSNVANRAPALFYLGPSERGNQFDLRFWVSDPRPGPAKLQSDVAKALFRQFKAAKVPLPMMYNMNINIDDAKGTDLTREVQRAAPPR
jgi:small-conductance mechanosensitive channel